MAQQFWQLLKDLEKTPEVQEFARIFKLTNAQAMALVCLKCGNFNQEKATAENTLLFIKEALEQLK